MKKISTIGAIALVTAIAFAACTKNNSSNPVPSKSGATFLKKDTVTPPHLLSPALGKDTVTPPIKSFSASSLIKKDTVTPPHFTPALGRDTVTPPKKGRNP